jgi:pilus assembly protein CpaE
LPASIVLLIDADPASADLIEAILSNAGYEVTVVEDADEGIRAATEYQLVVVDVVHGGRTAHEVCTALRATPESAGIPLLGIAQTDDVEERVGFLEVGADDVVSKPFDARELEARVEALLLRFQRSREVGGVAAPRERARATRLLVVFSPKGGVGTTTIAVNLALVLAERNPNRVALIDGDLQWGQVTTHLNLMPRETLGELALDEAGLREPELLRVYGTPHRSGLVVYAAPTRPDQAERVRSEHLRQILATAQTLYDDIVVDAGSALDDRTLTLFDYADVILYPVSPDLSAVKSVHSLMDHIGEAETLGSKSSFVVNHLFARDMLKLKDIEDTLGSKAVGEIPHDANTFLKAINEGVPVVLAAPKSPAAVRFRELASLLMGEMAAQSDTSQARRGLFGGILRRA